MNVINSPNWICFPSMQGSHTKIIASLSAVILVLAAVIVMLLSRQAKPPVLVSRTDPPKISFEDRSHEFGEISKEAPSDYAFKIHNIGGEPLEIIGVMSDCRCITLEAKDKIIEAGKVGDLQVILDPSLQDTGIFKDKITLFTNDPEHLKSQLEVTAIILPAEELPAKSNH